MRRALLTLNDIAYIVLQRQTQQSQLCFLLFDSCLYLLPIDCSKVSSSGLIDVLHVLPIAVSMSVFSCDLLSLTAMDTGSI